MVPLLVVLLPVVLLLGLAALAVCFALAAVFLPVFLVGILPCVVVTNCRRVAKRR